MSTLIGICGGSGSGKSTLAAKLVAALGADRAGLLAFDTYYRDHGHLCPRQRAEVNYDHPDSLDLELFVSHLDALSAHEGISVPVYDFATHTRSNETTRLDPREVIVVEGILLFAFDDIADRMAMRVFRDCPESTRFKRRVRRDVAERGRNPESFEKQLAATLKPMHDKYVQPSMDRAVLIVAGDGDLDAAARVVLKAFRDGQRRPQQPLPR